MTPHLDDHDLIDLSLGTADHPHLELCRRCRDGADQISGALHLLPLTLPPIAPPPTLRARLFASIAGPVHAHSAALAAMFERPEPELRALLARLESDTLPWTAFMPGIDHHPIASAPGRDIGLFRVAPGVLFPHHRHRGDERMRILQGSCSDSLGVVLAPGDEHHFPAGTAHALLTHHGPPLLLAYVSGGTEFTGLPL